MKEGILVEEASSDTLQIVTLRSTDGSLDEVGLGDFMMRNVIGEIRRLPGVGRATLFSTERSLRIWVDPDKLVGYGLTADDVTKAIAAQNAQVASGSIGAPPSRDGQKTAALVLVQGPAHHARGIRLHRAARQSATAPQCGCATWRGSRSAAWITGSPPASTASRPQVCR